jgi:ankyrin repeat protein
MVSPERNNVFHLAAGQGHHELIQELYASFGDKSLLSAQNSALDTPLHCAARAGHERAVSLLVQLAWGTGDHENILGCKNEAGDTALHLAARLGHTAAVEVIVFVAPELASEVNNAGVSPLYLAVMSRSVPAVRAITRCRDASSSGPSSQNALHAAVFEGSGQPPQSVDSESACRFVNR